MQYSTSDFKKFIYDDLATLCKHWVNFSPVTPEFKRVKGVHLSSISSLATFALLLDHAGIRTEFSVAITTQFCFTYTLENITAVPRGLHARLCHVFIVSLNVPAVNIRKIEIKIQFQKFSEYKVIKQTNLRN